MHERKFGAYMVSQQKHIYKYVQSHIIIIIIHQHVSSTLVTIISVVACNKNTLSVQIIEQKSMIKPTDVTLDFSVAFLMVIKYQIILLCETALHI
jgi:hypothetical protein